MLLPLGGSIFFVLRTKPKLYGSEPDENASLYTNSINIMDNQVLRIKVFRTNALLSRIFTNSYLFETNLNLRIISLATDPNNFCFSFLNFD
jgi:hypothetical protein